MNIYIIVLPRHFLVEAVLLPKGLKLAPHNACMAGLPGLLNYLPGRQSRGEDQRGTTWCPMACGNSLTPHEVLSDRIHMALTWNPLSKLLKLVLSHVR